MEEIKMRGKSKVLPATYCVTGASGYIGSWLVMTLLQKGYFVHATVRHPAKCMHLFSTWSGTDRLRLFQADLQEEGSFDEAVKGCDGVFHVAASMEFNVSVQNNIESYVQSNIIDPAIKGTLNVLKACLKSNVRRVIFTSSISTITAKDKCGNWRHIVDESCQTPQDHVWTTKQSGWIYVLSKLLSEKEAFKFAVENGIDLVSLITTTVAGPFLTSNVPSSIRVLLSPLTGDPEYLKILSAVNARMGSVALVHIEDICRAHLFLMDHPKAEARYICCVQSCTLSKLHDLLAQQYPACSNLQRCRFIEEEHDQVAPEISSKKLKDLGFDYKYEVEDIINEVISYCIDFGFIPLMRSS